MADVRQWKAVEYESVVSRLKVLRAKELEVEVMLFGKDKFTIGINQLRALAEAFNRVADEIGV